MSHVFFSLVVSAMIALAIVFVMNRAKFTLKVLLVLAVVATIIVGVVLCLLLLTPTFLAKAWKKYSKHLGKNKWEGLKDDLLLIPEYLFGGLACLVEMIIPGKWSKRKDARVIGITYSFSMSMGITAVIAGIHSVQKIMPFSDILLVFMIMVPPLYLMSRVFSANGDY
jgi:hypothetical protein